MALFRRFRSYSLILALFAVGVWLACSGIGHAPDYSYFESPRFEDHWSSKILGWQEAQQRDSQGSPSRILANDALADTFDRFLRAERRDAARRVVAWIQRESEYAYRPDYGRDHWPTFDEALASRSEDCDGLELLAHRALRALGIPKEQLFRAIMVDADERRHHMVTLWFEDPSDPWVIDPTGTIAAQLLRVSEVREWSPMRMFDEGNEYAVRTAR
jgi:predicted transglutaminase-like cysteine proteinase